MKHVIAILSLCLLPTIVLAADGRDRALPDQYECPGCGGWPKYRADMEAERLRQQRHSDYNDYDDSHRDRLEEERRRNDLLEEQNRILRDRADRDRYNGY